MHAKKRGRNKRPGSGKSKVGKVKSGTSSQGSKNNSPPEEFKVLGTKTIVLKQGAPGGWKKAVIEQCLAGDHRDRAEFTFTTKPKPLGDPGDYKGTVMVPGDTFEGRPQ